MKTWNVKILFILFLLVAPLQLLAQQPDENKEERDEKIERLKIAFITRKLNLTSEEAEKFWPVYNELEDKVKELHKANRKINQEIRESDDKLTDEDAKKKLATILENEGKETELRKDYSDKIAKIIGYKRTLKLLSLEHEFRRELLESLRDRQGPPQHNPSQKPNGGRP